MPRVSPTTFIARLRARRDERGAVMILAAGGLIVALVASALAVDLGRQASEKKSDQLIADLAALDAARELEPLVVNVPGVTAAVVIADATAAAEESARRNGFDPDADGHDLVAEVGSVDAQNQFTPGGASPNAVKVTVSSVLDYIFEVGGRTLTATAVAMLGSASGLPGQTTGSGSGGGTTGTTFAGFEIGSALASADFDAVSAPVINRVMGQWIGGNADVMSWKGLGDANVTLSALQQEIGALGTAVGTPQELLAADLTLNRLFTATANALDRQGTSEATAAATLFRGSAGIIAQSTNTTTFKLADIMKFNQGAGDTVAAANMKVRNLVVAAAQAANGDNVVSVPTAGVTVPRVSNTAVTLQVVEPMQRVFGTVGDWGETAQIKLTVTPTIDTVLPNLPLLSEPKVTGAFPFLLDAAGAKGTIAQIDCSAPAMLVGVDTKPVTGSGNGSLQVTAKLPLLGTVPLVNVPTVATMPQVAAQHTDLPFAYDSEFHPTWNGSKRAGTTPLHLDTTTVVTPGTATVLRTVAVSTQDLVNAAVAQVAPVLGEVEDRIVNPLIKSLGLTVGVADVVATNHNCTPGTPPTATQTTSGTPAPPVTIYRPKLVG